MKNVSEFFGCKVFDDRVMKANLSAKIYQSEKRSMRGQNWISVWPMQLHQR